MAVNPMQRQARTYFLLGLILALLIGGAIAAFLFMQIQDLNDELDAEKAGTMSVYVLNQDVKSGQVITSDLFTMTTVKSAGVPSDATSDITSMLNSYSLCDNEGNPIKTGYETEGDPDTSYLYIEYSDGSPTEKVYEEDATGELYTLNSDNTKNYITTTEQAIVAKIDLKSKTVLSGSFITRSDEAISDDVREQEYNVVVLPIELVTNDYVDIRLMLPNGQDYIVISKKQVTIPLVNGEYVTDTIQMDLTEDEIITMSSAIVDAWQIEGAKLYATKYTDAGIQEAATPTYAPSAETVRLITNDPNVLSTAASELASRYNNDFRNNINDQIETNGVEDGVSSGQDSSISSTQESRKEYLQSLTTTTTTN